MIYAVLVAVGLTIIICLIEAPYKSKACLRACCCFPFFTYLTIFIVGNVATTLLTPQIISEMLPASLARSPWNPFIYGFFGVFAFHVVVSNTNITFFKNGVLTIDDWITTARDHAVASAIKKEIMLTDRKNVELTAFLKKLPEQDLNTYISRYLGSDHLKKIHDEIVNQNVDPKLYKALTLATEKPNEIDAIRRKST